MEKIVGFLKWKKKPGVTVFTVNEDNHAVTGSECKIRFFGDGLGTGNYQKIDADSIGKECQFTFTEGFNGQAQIYDVFLRDSKK